jgi:hypothetical protein
MAGTITSGTEEQWDEEMRRVYSDAIQECGYNATYFIQMVSELGGLNTARTLLQKTGLSDGLTELWKRGKLDLTMEARMFQRGQDGGYKWQALFTADEFEIARRRLTELRYPPAISGAL